MKKMIVTVLILLSGLLNLAGINLAWAEEDRPAASASIGAFSKYIWRGYELSDDSVVVQPSISVAYKGFTMSLWGNLDTDLDDRDPAVDNKSQLTETDFTLSYERSFGPATFGVGYVYYGLDSLDDSEEIFASASVDVLLSPKVTIYREISHLPSWYVNLGLSHSLPLYGDIALNLSGGIGYYHSDDEAFVEVDGNLIPTSKKYRALHDGMLSASLEIPIAKYMLLTPSLNFTFPLSGKAENLLRSTSFSDRANHLYGGLTLAISF